VTGAIVGARQPDQVDDWIRAADAMFEPVDAELLDRLAAI
jgi:aryl-alcohol dehydrogenase-like predicted oxidoreductase